MKVKLKEARARLTEIVRAVHEGQHVLLTDRGRPVAGVVPTHELAMLEILTQEEWLALKSKYERGKS